MRLLGMTPLVVSFNRSGAGLGNRIRAVLGAKSLAEAEGRRFAYVWPRGADFGPRLDQLWAFDAPVVPRGVSRALAPLWPYRDHTLEWLTEDVRDEFVWQIRTPHALLLPPRARPWQDEFRALEPVSEVAERVMGTFDRHLRDQPYVGVMVRAHARSHAKTLESSPVEWFTATMTQMRIARPDLRFFLSCDTPDAAAQICRDVPGTVTQPDKGEYNSLDGVRAAVADLYLLASSRFILGPHWSSFVELAEALSANSVGSRTPRETRGSGALHDRDVPDPLHPWRR